MIYSFNSLFNEKIDNLYGQANALASGISQITRDQVTGFDRITEEIKNSMNNLGESALISEKSFAWYVRQVNEVVMPLVCTGIENYSKIFGSSFFTQQYLQFSKEIVVKYIGNIKNKLKEVQSDIGHFCLAMNFINEDLTKLSQIFPTSNTFVLSDRFTELFEFLIRFQIERVVEGLQKSSINVLNELHQEITESSESLPERIEVPTENAACYLVFCLLTGILRLEPMLDSAKSFITSSSMVVSLIISHILNFFQILRKNLSSFSTNSTGAMEYAVPGLQKLEKNGNFLIGVLKLMIHLEESVPKIISTLSKSFAELNYDRCEVSDIMNKVAKPELLVVMKLSQEDLLLYYIEYYARVFTELVEIYCEEKWKFQNEPIDVSETICRIVSTLIAARKELKAFFRGELISNQKLKRKRVKHNVELEMERIFARKVKVIDNLKFDLGSIIGCLAKFTLKGLYEEVRMQEFSTGGCQQIEVDAGFLGNCISYNILEESLVSGYVQEIISSAAGRCTLYEPLQSTILESIVENKINQMNLKQNKL